MMIVIPTYRVKATLLKNKRRNHNLGIWEGDVVELDLRVPDENNALRKFVDILLFNGAQEIYIVYEDPEKGPRAPQQGPLAQAVKSLTELAY